MPCSRRHRNWKNPASARAVAKEHIHGQEILFILSRLLLAEGGFVLQLPDLRGQYVRRAGHRAERDPGLELLLRLHRLCRRRRTAAPGPVGAQHGPVGTAPRRPGHRRHLRRLLAGHQGNPGAPARQQRPDGGDQPGPGRGRPQAEERQEDPPHGGGAHRRLRLRRAGQAREEAPGRHQDRRLRGLPDQPPLRHRRRILREPQVPRQDDRDHGRRGLQRLREKGVLLRRRAGLLGTGKEPGPDQGDHRVRL